MNQELGTKKKENTSKFCKAKLEAFSFFLLFIFLVFTIFSFWSSVAYAAPAPAASQPVSLPNPLGISSPQVLLGRAAKALTGISGSLASRLDRSPIRRHVRADDQLWSVYGAVSHTRHDFVW